MQYLPWSHLRSYTQLLCHILSLEGNHQVQSPLKKRKSGSTFTEDRQRIGGPIFTWHYLGPSLPYSVRVAVYRGKMAPLLPSKSLCLHTVRHRDSGRSARGSVTVHFCGLSITPFKQ
jgi:hypothetical protein